MSKFSRQHPQIVINLKSPTSLSLIFENFRSCTGGGYWADDLITGDEYYVMAPNEKCSFSCDSNIFGENAVLSESYGYWNTITCRGDKGLLDDIDWQHNWRQMPTCVPVAL